MAPQGDIVDAIQELIHAIAKEKSTNLLESEAIVDDVHLLLDCANYVALARAMNFLKGVSSRCIFQRFPELKLDVGVNSFWQHPHAAKEVQPGAAGTLRHYIRTQRERLEKYAR